MRMGRDPRGWARRNWPGIAAAGIVLVAGGARLALVARGWPGTDSDDATMGLMARHILLLGEHPIFFWGQAYMGTIEAHLAAGIFAVIGISEFALKCALVALFAAFMGVMFWLLRQIFDDRAAVAGLVLLALGSDDTLYHELEAYGGYLETLLFGALMIAIAVGVMRPAAPDRPGWRRAAGYAAWGLAAGIGIYSDPLVLPFVALSALALIVMHWREVRGRLGAVAVAGVLLGVSPWGIYALTAPGSQSAASFLQRTPPSHATAGPDLLTAIADRVLGTVVIALPNTTGANALCPLNAGDAWPPARWGIPAVARCIVLRGAWGGALVVALVVALWLEARAFWPLWQRGAGTWSPDDRRDLARLAGRLVALGAPAGTIALFTLSSASSFAPWENARYIISTLVALPVIAATLWERLPALRWRRAWGQRASRALLAGAGGMLLLGLLTGTISAFREIPAAQAQTRQQMDLVHTLLVRHQTRIYADFWICLRAAFQSNEQITCSVMTTQLTVAPSRYAAYDRVVAAAAHPAYVFAIGSAQAMAFPAYAAAQGWQVQTTIVDGQWVIYAR